jgi:SAM-dependent methyltransferase
VCGGDSSGQLLQAPDRFHARKDLYKLVRCDACGLVRLADPPSPKEMPFHYGQGYHQSIQSAGESDLARRWARHRNTVLNLKAGGTILDIGCGSGAFLRTLRGGAWRLHGVEISEQEAARARTSAGAEVFVGDPLDAPFEPESFDVITCFHLLEHVYQPLELLKRVRIWLRPGGFLYVILPNIESWEARIFRSYWYGLELPRHLFHFSPLSLERAVYAAHMRTVRLHTLFEDSFSEHSFHYISEDLFHKFGISRAPLTAGLPASFPVKVIRKVFRLSIESLFRYAASAAGRGASIEGIFGKEQ